MKYKIGSFNMRNFGANPNRDFSKIADIIRGEELDIVAFQEILSEGKGVKFLLENYVKRQFYNWDFCWASPKESSDLFKIEEIISNDTRGEGYTYIWNTRKFKLAEVEKYGKTEVFKPRIINSLSNDVYKNCSFFARRPYYIRLQPCYGGFFELRLINIHIYFGNNNISEVQKRIIEYNTLVQDIYPDISKKRYGDFRPAYTIAMGDYNLNIFRSQIPTQSGNHLAEVYNYSRGSRKYQVITIQDQLTTITENNKTNELNNRYANNYDHFTYSPELSHFLDVNCGVIDAVNKYCNGDFDYYKSYISDHLPIVIEIKI